MKAPIVLFVLCCSVPAAAQVAPRVQTPAGGATEKAQGIRLPADWAQRDLEGKWHAYRTALAAEPADPNRAKAWVVALAEHGELELLEWIAVFQGWRFAGPQLAAADAPQLLRTAIWNLDAYDSHNKDNAQDLLRRLGSVTRSWLEAHPGAQRGRAAKLLASLREANVVPGDASRYLPPLDPTQFLVPWLDAPAQLEEFGDRLVADPKVRYVHQVLRALDGLLVHGEVDDLVVQKVLGLGRHGNPAVRAAAFTTLTKLPGGLVPWQALRKLTHDAAAEPGRRELAAMALSFSTHPEAFFALHEIAANFVHPGNRAAITRLGEIGDDTTNVMLQTLPSTDQTVLRRIAEALSQLNRRRASAEHLQVAQLHTLLQRIAWLRVTRDPRAPAHARAATDLLRAELRKDVTLAAIVEGFLATPAPMSPFRGDEAERVESELAKLARELAESGR